MHRKASQLASRSSLLSVVERERRIHRFDGVPRISEPVGFLPRVFRASRACAVSDDGGWRISYIGLIEIGILPFGVRRLLSLRSWRRTVMS